MAKGGFHPPLAPGDAPRLVIKLDAGEDPASIVAIAKQHIANLKTPDPAALAVEDSTVEPDAVSPLAAVAAGVADVTVNGQPSTVDLGDLVVEILPPD